MVGAETCVLLREWCISSSKLESKCLSSFQVENERKQIYFVRYKVRMPLGSTRQFGSFRDEEQLLKLANAALGQELCWYRV